VAEEHGEAPEEKEETDEEWTLRKITELAQ